MEVESRAKTVGGKELGWVSTERQRQSPGEWRFFGRKGSCEQVVTGLRVSLLCMFKNNMP